uniref:Putative secreted protein n=1 Tax=Anopheles darlingi TaxID=43151 RepID=A0A2M4D9B4_ANODA
MRYMFACACVSVCVWVGGETIDYALCTATTSTRVHRVCVPYGVGGRSTRHIGQQQTDFVKTSSLDRSANGVNDRIGMKPQ